MRFVAVFGGIGSRIRGYLLGPPWDREHVMVILPQITGALNNRCTSRSSPFIGTYGAWPVFPRVRILTSKALWRLSERPITHAAFPLPTGYSTENSEEPLKRPETSSWQPRCGYGQDKVRIPRGSLARRGRSGAIFKPPGVPPGGKGGRFGPAARSLAESSLLRAGR